MANNNFTDVRDQLKAMLDSCEDKPSIERIGTITSLIDKIEAEHNQIHAEQKELLRDYKELVKHQSFAPTGTENNVTGTTEVSLEDFLKVKPTNN